MADTDKNVLVPADGSAAEKAYENNPIMPDEIYIEEDIHHHLHRGLKSRQVAMIAIGGAIGMSARSYWRNRHGNKS